MILVGAPGDPAAQASGEGSWTLFGGGGWPRWARPTAPVVDSGSGWSAHGLLEVRELAGLLPDRLPGIGHDGDPGGVVAAVYSSRRSPSSTHVLGRLGPDHATPTHLGSTAVELIDDAGVVDSAGAVTDRLLAMPNGGNHDSGHESREASPYTELDRSAWAALASEVEDPLTEDELTALRGLGDALDLEEVREVFLPISRLLSLYVETAGRLHRDQEEFLHQATPPRTPFVIGLAGSVAVGKSTTARVLQHLLAHWPEHPERRPGHHRRLPLP